MCVLRTLFRRIRFCKCDKVTFAMGFSRKLWFYMFEKRNAQTTELKPTEHRPNGNKFQFIGCRWYFQLGCFCRSIAGIDENLFWWNIYIMCGEGRREHFDEQQKQKRFKIILIYGQYIWEISLVLTIISHPNGWWVFLFLFLFYCIFSRFSYLKKGKNTTNTIWLKFSFHISVCFELATNKFHKSKCINKSIFAVIPQVPFRICPTCPRQWKQMLALTL